MIVGLREFGGRPPGLDAYGGQLQVDVARRLPGIDGRDAAEPLGEGIIERLERNHGDRAVNEHDVVDVPEREPRLASARRVASRWVVLRGGHADPLPIPDERERHEMRASVGRGRGDPQLVLGFQSA